MKTHFLIPNSFKKLGWILFVPSFITGSILLVSGFEFDNNFKIQTFAFISDQILAKIAYFKIIENGILDKILLVLIIIGLLLIGFSKTKNEDEFIFQIRYESLVWATYFNFGLMIIATLFVYDFPYFYILLSNLFAMLLFFIIRFHYKIYKLNTFTSDDE